MRHPSLLISAAALVLLSAAEVHAQSWSEQTGCSAPANTELLRRTLPLEVLDHLERMQNSPFAHAFLIRFIADDSAGGHHLSRCARAFIVAGPRELSTLRQNLPDVPAILAALRTAEQARLQAQRMADSAPTLGRLARELRSDTSTATLHSHREQLSTVRSTCERLAAGMCSPLDRSIAAIDAVIAARSERDRTADASRQAAAAAGRAAEEYRKELDGLAEDSTAVLRLRAQGESTDSAAVAALESQIEARVRRAEAASIARTAAEGTAAAADSAARVAAATALSTHAGLLENVAALETRFRQASVSDRTVAPIEGARLASSLEPVSTPPVESAGAPPPVRSANVMLELTDFIIARARSELVNAFVVNLHAWAREQPLMQHGFPDTWGLMSGIATRRDSLLDAVEVGRIPLTTWRATLAGDFVTLPVNLLEASESEICRGANPSLAAAGDGTTCLQRVALLRPLAPLAQRLLEGDAVFDVLRDAKTLGSPVERGVDDTWRRISQGLTIVSAMAETYLAQGHAPMADPTRHPYILSARSFAQVPQRQRDALLRLLLVRAVTSVDQLPAAEIDLATLQNATAELVQGLERLSSRPTTEELRAIDAALLVRGSFDALAGATVLAREFAHDSLDARLAATERRWTALSSVIEPIVSRDFGLAMARTTVLLREWRGVEVPPRMLTLLSLATALTEARDGDQVRRAFEAAASPVGGWQAKRYGESRLSITAFPGAAFGFESVIAEGEDPDGIDDWAPALGASLPIGFEWQPGWMRNRHMDTSRCFVCGAGFFVPLIDVGALLSYRLDGTEDVASEPNATVRQVFAPGAFVSVSLTRTIPLTLIAGGQLLPSLRKVDTGGEAENRSAWRAGVGIGVDVLLFGF